MVHLTLSQVNAMPPQEFGAAFGRVFEHSPWIAERALACRPFASRDALHAAMVEVVRSASAAERLGLLRVHPELAGREAQAGALTPDSANEQSNAGLNALSAHEMERITSLNRRHAEKYGFPFVIAARCNPKERIFSEFERRLGLDREAALSACLDEVFIITRIRIDDLMATG